VVWGARTTATNRSWQYVNVRRLFLFLEESIEEGIRWAVFEPNIPPLWKKLNRTITAFLTQQFRDGALFGNKPEEAFYVRIDEVLNPDAERALGRLHIEIGIRPAYPAEFIIVRIGIWAGGSEISES
jgi:phage tail sheath protein FI